MTITDERGKKVVITERGGKRIARYEGQSRHVFGDLDEDQSELLHRLRKLGALERFREGVLAKTRADLRS
jgi:hypothetical protein